MAYRHILLFFSLIVSVVGHLAFFSALSPGAQQVGGSGRYALSATLVESGLQAKRFDERNSAIEQGAAKEDSSVDTNVVTTNSIDSGESSMAGALGSLLLENYLPSSMLTAPPSPIDSIDLAPVGYRIEGLVGEVELMLLISSDGGVDEVLLISSSLPPVFAEHAKNVFRKARFTAGLVNSTPVRSRVRIVLGPVSAAEQVTPGASTSTAVKSPR